MTLHIAGVVLAGGQSRRFGTDKAEALYRGRPLIDWAFDALTPHTGLLLVSGRTHPIHRTVIDRPRPGLGPLGGLAGALQTAREMNCSHLLSVPCDTPELPDGLLAALCTHPKGSYVANCPVIGFWPTQLGEALEAYLASDGNKAVRAWADNVALEPMQGVSDIPNINNPTDLAQLTGLPRDPATPEQPGVP